MRCSAPPTATTTTYWSPYAALRKQALQLAAAVGTTRTRTTTTTMTVDQVLLLYIDTDQDKVLICSDADLDEAMEQYAFRNGSCLKVYARIKEPDAVVATTTAAAAATTTAESRGIAAESATQTPTAAPPLPPRPFTAAAESRGVSAESATQTPTAAPPLPPRPLTAAAESRGVAAESATQTPTASCTRPRSNQVQVPITGLVESVAAVLATSAISLSGQAQRVSKKIARKAAAATHKAAAASTSTTSTATTSTRNSTNIETPSPPPPPPPPRVFIHGRHTCDGCLTTPIVGQRFHAVNLPDYDLCSKCKNNYKGSEIQFEPNELDRDVPFQDRWHVRHNRQLQHRGGGGPGGQDGARHHHYQARHPHWRQNGCHQPGPRGFGLGPNRCGPRGWGSPAGFNRAHAPGAGMTDLAVAEAIRLSLLDLNGGKPVKPVPTESESKAAADEQGTVASLVPEDDGTEKAFAETIGLEAVVAPSAPLEEEVISHATSNSFASDAEGNGDIAAALGETLDKFAEAIEAVSFEFDRTPLVEHCSSDDDDDDDDIDDEPEIIVEADMTGNLEGGNVDHIHESPPCIGFSAANPNDGHGATILDGPEDVPDDGSHESWQVVAEDQQATYDQAVARATQMIGSALFNSDLANSTGGEFSALSHSTVSGPSSSGSSSSSSSGTSVSSASSVPTTVPSLALGTQVPAVQLECWAIQLNQLHELGFSNDALSVDILERFNAANIGVDSTDEVSVTQVVNELVKDW